MSRRIIRFGSERAVRSFLRSTPSVRRGSVQYWCAQDGKSRLAIIIPAKIAPRAVDRTKLRRIIRTSVQGITGASLRDASLCIRVIGSPESILRDLGGIFQTFS